MNPINAPAPPAVLAIDQPYMLRHDRDGIATLVLNRSDRQNPLSMVMIGALSAQFKMIAGDSSVRKHLQVTPTSQGTCVLGPVFAGELCSPVRSARTPGR